MCGITRGSLVVGVCGDRMKFFVLLGTPMNDLEFKYRVDPSVETGKVETVDGRRCRDTARGGSLNDKLQTQTYGIHTTATKTLIDGRVDHAEIPSTTCI
jgi:hypothetical protein